MRFTIMTLLLCFIGLGIVSRGDANVVNAPVQEWIDIPPIRCKLTTQCWRNYNRDSIHLLTYNIYKIDVNRNTFWAGGQSMPVLLDCNYKTYKEINRSNIWIAMTQHEAPVFAAICAK